MLTDAIETDPSVEIPAQFQPNVLDRKPN